MLVLSRKQKQQITFPNLGISVEVLRIAGNAVRLGVDAPREVTVLRGELPPRDEFEDPASGTAESRHAVRNRLNKVRLAAHLMKKQIARGKYEAAKDTSNQMVNELSCLDELAGELRSDSTKAEDQPTPRRALLVDDDPNERELLAGILRMQGYHVDTANDGLQAMTFLSNHANPDVVVLDMHMPRMDGNKTLSAIRRNPAYRDIKVMVVSGADRGNVNLSNQSRLVDRWFAKPLNPQSFVEQLEQELEPEAA